MSGEYLLGLDEHVGQVHRVQIIEGDVNTALLRLFNKAFRPKIQHVKWWAGVPGVDRAVVFCGTDQTGSDRHSLHVSFSDRRVWGAAA